MSEQGLWRRNAAAVAFGIIATVAVIGGTPGTASAQLADDATTGTGADANAEGDAELQALREAAKAEAKRDSAPRPEASGDLTRRVPSGPPSGENAFNPAIGAVGNMYVLGTPRGQLVNDHGEEVGNRFWLREVEFSLDAAIDRYARATFIFAAEAHAPGEFEFHPEEIFADIDLDALFGLTGFTIRAGRFRTPMGLVNRLHTHDLPHFFAPYATQQFLGDHGDIRDGAIIVTNFSFGGPALRLELGAFNGNHPILFADDESEHLSSAFNFTLELPFEDAAELYLGASHMLGVQDEDHGTVVHFFAAHLQLRLYPGSSRRDFSIVFQAEGYYVPRLAGESNVLGGFAFVQVQLMEQLFVGVRGDWTDVVDDPINEIWALSLYVSWYPTEFLRLRLGYEHREIQGGPVLDMIGMQLTFFIGAHPSHSFEQVR